MSGRVVLYINRSDSSCGACNKNADPHEPAHIMGRMVGEGCGAVYTHLSSYYTGMDAACQRMRPDLLWLEPLDALAERS